MYLYTYTHIWVSALKHRGFYNQVLELKSFSLGMKKHMQKKYKP